MNGKFFGYGFPEKNLAAKKTVMASLCKWVIVTVKLAILCPSGSLEGCFCLAKICKDNDNLPTLCHILYFGTIVTLGTCRQVVRQE